MCCQEFARKIITIDTCKSENHFSSNENSIEDSSLLFWLFISWLSMSTFDQVIIDDRDLVNRYFGDTNFDDDQFGLPNIRSNTLRPLDTRINPSSDFLTDNDTSGLLGRRVFLESPSFGNKDEEDIYRWTKRACCHRFFELIWLLSICCSSLARFVPSRLSDNPVSLPAPNGDTLIDSLDFELNVLGATNLTRPLAFENNSRFIRDPKPLLPSTQIKNPTIDKPTESNLVRWVRSLNDSVFLEKAVYSKPCCQIEWRRNVFSFQIHEQLEEWNSFYVSCLPKLCVLRKKLFKLTDVFPSKQIECRLNWNLTFSFTRRPLCERNHDSLLCSIISTWGCIIIKIYATNTGFYDNISFNVDSW